MGLEGKPVSTLHEKPSYDLADFPVPTGREEAWRFTPLGRLRGLHDATAKATGQVGVDVDDRQTEDVARERSGARRVPHEHVDSETAQ